MSERFNSYKTDGRLGEMKTRFIHDAMWILSLTIGLFLLLALLSHNPSDNGWAYASSDAQTTNLAGEAGAWVSSFLITLFGAFSYGLPAIAFYRAWCVFRDRKNPEPWNPLILVLRAIGWVVFVVVSCALLTVHVSSVSEGSAGGYLGITFSEWFFPLFGLTGSTLILLLIGFLSLTLAAHISWLQVVDGLGKKVFDAAIWVKEKWQKKQKQASEQAEVKRVVSQRKQNLEVQLEKQSKRKPPQIKPLKKKAVEKSERSAKEQQKSLFDDSIPSGSLPELNL